MIDLEKLRAAARLVREAASGLDDKVAPCVACGLNRYNDFSEHRLKHDLDAMANRLDRIGRNVPGPKDPPSRTRSGNRG